MLIEEISAMRGIIEKYVGQYKNVTEVRKREVALLQEERARLGQAESELQAFICENDDTAQAELPQTIFEEAYN
jgi:hypothetical protein